LSFDDPRIAVKNLIDVHGLDPIAAIRATATSCAAVLNTSMMDGALVLRADHDSADPIAAASRIAEHFHLPLGASDIGERVAAMPALPSNAEEREPAAEAAWEPVARARSMRTGNISQHPRSETLFGRAICSSGATSRSKPRRE